MPTPRERTIGPGQFLIIIVVGAIVILGWDLGHRILATMDLLQQDSQADSRLHVLEQQNQDLTQLKNQVGSDAWVEGRVRNEWHWTRDGETIFVPAATPVAAPSPAPASASPPPLPAKPGWQQWLDSLINAIFGPAS